MPSDLVRKWLRQVLTPYTHREQVFAQVDASLSAFPCLSPKTESFTFDDGRAALLLCLSGTIPVSYRGASYNIPLAVWIPHEFPQQPPIIYVTPTSDMVIRKGTYVEPGGQCQGGYLQTWTTKPEACSLTSLLEFLQDIFSREPPLYAKPKPLTTVPQSSTPPPQPPRPPRPPQLSRTSDILPQPRPHLELSTKPVPPARPPPLYSHSSSAASHTSTRMGPQSVHLSHPHRSTPLSTPHGVSNMPRSLTSTPNGHPDSAMSYNSQLTPSRNLDPSMPYIYQPTRSSAYPETTSTTSMIDVNQRLSQMQLREPAQPSEPAPNLLDDLEDPHHASATPSEPSALTRASSNAPPRPPNPALLALRHAVYARLQAELAQLTASLTFEHGQLMVLQHDLLKGEPAIRDEMGRLEAVKDVCVGVGYRYETLVSELKDRIEDLRNRPAVPVDELVCSNTVLYNQLIELIVDDQAIDDTIYHLARGLNNSDVAKIDLEKFLKRIRALGREQFLKRSTINQIMLQLAISGRPIASSGSTPAPKSLP